MEFRVMRSSLDCCRYVNDVPIRAVWQRHALRERAIHLTDSAAKVDQIHPVVEKFSKASTARRTRTVGQWYRDNSLSTRRCPNPTPRAPESLASLLRVTFSIRSRSYGRRTCSRRTIGMHVRQAGSIATRALLRSSKAPSQSNPSRPSSTPSRYCLRRTTRRSIAPAALRTPRLSTEEGRDLLPP